MEALTEVQLAVSNYRQADASCTVNREERDGVPGFSHPYWAISADSTHSGAVRTLHKGEESAEERWADGRLDGGDGRQTFQSHSTILAMLVAVWSQNCARDYRNVSH